MIVKKEWVNKETGEKTVQMTSDKEGYKVLKDGDSWKEVKMSQEERSKRDHGGKDPHRRGQQSTKGKLSGQSKANIEADYKKDKEESGINNNVIIKSSKVNESKKDLDKKKKKVDDLSYKLRKAKLDYNSSMLDQKITDFEKKENYYTKAAKVVEDDKQKLKERNKYFVKDEPVKDDGLEGDIVDHIEQVLGEPQVPETDVEIVVKKDSSIEEKLDKVEKIQEAFFGNSPSRVKEDVINRIDNVFEAPEDEEEEDPKPEEEEGGDEGGGDEEGGDDFGLDGDEEGGEDDLGLDDEDGETEDESSDDQVDMQDNEIAIQTKVNDFNVDENNVYDFYDFIADKISDPTARDMLNAEYAQMEPSRRKVTSAREFFKRVVKRTNVLNQKEADAINGGGVEGEDEGGLEL
jgi:hypothetical protein